MGRTSVVKSKAEKHMMKVASRKKHQQDLRRAAFISDYMLLTVPDLHREATLFVEQLQAKYPNKWDVRKTHEFRHWQKKQLGLVGSHSTHATAQTTVINPEVNTELQIPEGNASETVLHLPKDGANHQQKEMVLQIPLISLGTKTKEIPPVLEAQEDQSINIFDDIPNDVINNLLAEIRADPYLSAIMDDINLNEEEVQDLCPELDIGLNIEIGNPLEEELNNMLFL